MKKKIIYLLLVGILFSVPKVSNAQVAEARCAAEIAPSTAACKTTAFTQIVNKMPSTEPGFSAIQVKYEKCLADCSAALGTCLAKCKPELLVDLTFYCDSLSIAGSKTFVHEPFFDYFVMDMGASISRGIQVLVKYLLGDGNKLVAELVYEEGDEESGNGCKGGGCGGTYTGDNGTSIAPLSAVASPITDIPAEAGAYPSDIKVQETSIAKLADLRIKEIVKENASLDELSQDKWAILYRAQQRSIQAMTDALVMKKAYKDLASVAEGVSSGSYGNYSEALSTVATRRLTLDALMALRKRVIAARVRARAELMEMAIESVVTAPKVDEGGISGNTGSKDDDSSSSVVDGGQNSNPDPGIEDYGLGGNSDNTEPQNNSEAGSDTNAETENPETTNTNENNGGEG